MINRSVKNGPSNGPNEDVSYTLNTMDRHVVADGLDRASFNQGKNAQFDFTVLPEIAPPIVAKGPGAVCHPSIQQAKTHITHKQRRILQ